jgi:hypothetical protein
MAGFPKFPIPRYLNTGLWLLNRNWKNNLRHTFPPTFLLVFLIYRTVSLTVNTTPEFGHYLDPEEHDSPKKIVF